MFEECTSEKIKSIKEKLASINQESKDWKYSGKWLRCVSLIMEVKLNSLLLERHGVIRYTDPLGKNQTYETVERTTRHEVIGVDGVDIISMILTIS